MDQQNYGNYRAQVIVSVLDDALEIFVVDATSIAGATVSINAHYQSNELVRAGITRIPLKRFSDAIGTVPATDEVKSVLFSVERNEDGIHATYVTCVPLGEHSRLPAMFAVQRGAQLILFVNGNAPLDGVPCSIDADGVNLFNGVVKPGANEFSIPQRPDRNAPRIVIQADDLWPKRISYIHELK